MSPRLALSILVSSTLALAACVLTPEQRMVGAWSLDPSSIQLPASPFPGAERRVRSALAGTTLKLRSDGTFTLVLQRLFEGKWRLERDQLVLESAGKVPVLRLRVSPDYNEARFSQPTFFGEASLRLRKTG